VKRHRLRVAWEDHATILQHEKQFEAKYRMPYEAFMKLATKIVPKVSTVAVSQQFAIITSWG